MQQKKISAALSFIKRNILLVVALSAVMSCSKSEDPAVAAPTTNTLTFETVYNNVSMSASMYGIKWQLNAVIALAPVGGFDQKLALNIKFLQQPTANASYTIVDNEADITSTSVMLFINYVDYNPSPADNVSTSYFLKSGTAGVVDVTVASGKVTIKFNGLTLSGNRGGGDKANVAANITEN